MMIRRYIRRYAACAIDAHARARYQQCAAQARARETEACVMEARRVARSHICVP